MSTDYMVILKHTSQKDKHANNQTRPKKVQLLNKALQECLFNFN